MTDHILGVDFSGAEAAGSSIWVTTLEVDGETATVTNCVRASQEWGARRDDAYSGLVAEITAGGVSAVGLDFPFSIPKVVLDELSVESWEDYLANISKGELFTDAEDFKETCKEKAKERTNGTNIRRETDYKHAGMCPYDHQIYRMTYHGARGVLAELSENQDTSVRPMQSESSATQVYEIYPAAVFHRIGGYRTGYKGSTGSDERREVNITKLVEEGLEIENREDFESNDDALDSLAAAFAAKEALGTEDFDDDCKQIEGQIFH